eukprot:jgi/Antlo1/1681/99
MEKVQDRAECLEDGPIFKEKFQCRICRVVEDPLDSFCDLVSPCACKGTMKYVHRSCLKMWRFRGKRIEEIRKCEQCLTFYTIDDEIIPHGMIVKMTSVLMLCLIYIGAHFVSNLFLEAVFIVTEDLSYPDTTYIFYFVQKNSAEIPQKTLPKASMEKKQALQFGFYGTIIVISIIYQLLQKRNFLYILNYLFTLWRIIYFNYTIDYSFLGLLSIHQCISLFKDICKFVDSLLVFILNYH